MIPYDTIYTSCKESNRESSSGAWQGENLCRGVSMLQFMKWGGAVRFATTFFRLPQVVLKWRFT